MQKIIRINLSKMTVKEEKIPANYKYLGGRGLTSTIVFNEINPLCHPLSEDYCSWIISRNIFIELK